jgi:putative ABC transport system ATP-binding protein
VAREPVVSTQGVRKTYGEGKGLRAALDGVSLTVEAGELLVLVGASGSGKSTLLAILGGLDRSYEGSVTLFGRDLRALSDAEVSRLRGRRVGFVFQAFHLLGHLTVLDNVLAPALFDPDGTPREQRALELIERLGLRDRAHDRPSELSGGQRQRVAIARALLPEPDLLLCDEPTGNLDATTGAEVIALFRELHAAGGLTIVAVTHERRLASIGTRTLALEGGRLIDAPAEVGS